MIRPLHDYLLVKRQDPEKQSKGGIIIPDAAAEKQETAQVVAVGPGKRTEAGALVPVGVSPGDTVLIAKYAGQEVKVEGQTLHLLRGEDVLAVVEAASTPQVLPGGAVVAGLPPAAA